ncbi:unnamed protein product, partial [Amoebophrya sp. A25]
SSLPAPSADVTSELLRLASRDLDDIKSSIPNDDVGEPPPRIKKDNKHIVRELVLEGSGRSKTQNHD